MDDRFAEILDSFAPDVVHAQHFKGLSATIPERCAEREVACLATLHDFWTICHREQLYRPEGTRCRGPESTAKCAACYADAIRESDDPAFEAGASGRPWKAVAQRSAALNGALAATDRLIAPSTFLRETFIEFGTPPDRIVQCRNGITTGAFVDGGFDPGTPVRIGYVGRITEMKGVHHLVRAFRAVEGTAELHIHGEFDPEREYHARLREQATDAVAFHGRYDDPATPYEGIDVLIVPSIWYENSPLVIQEAFAAGVPVITGDIGGMAELVTDRTDGLTFETGTPSALAAELRRVVRSPSLLSELRAGIDPPKDIADHAAEIEGLYATCLGKRA